MRKAMLVGMLLAAVVTPVAQARPTLAVQASAVAVETAGVLNVQFQCAAADVTGASVSIRTCSFGSLYAPVTGSCFECVNPPVAFTSGSGALRAGGSPFLCVSAISYTPGSPTSVTRCGPYDSLTGTAVVAG